MPHCILQKLNRERGNQNNNHTKKMGQRLSEETPKNKEVREGKSFWQEPGKGKVDTVSEQHRVLLQFKESNNVTSAGWDRGEEGRGQWGI